MKLLLTGPGWELEVGEGAPAALRGRRMAAFVPGCVHGDLMAAGVIPDPDRGDGEAAQAWVGRTEFIYRTRVEVPAAFLESGHRAAAVGPSGWPAAAGRHPAEMVVVQAFATRTTPTARAQHRTSRRL